MTGKSYYITTLADRYRHAPRCASSHWTALDQKGGESSKILVLIEADQRVHLALEDDPAFEALPHPLAQKPTSAAALAIGGSEAFFNKLRVTGGRF